MAPRVLAALAFLLAAEAALGAQSRSSLEPNGLELTAVEASTAQAPAGARRIRLRFALRNIGASAVTVLTRNLQTELWDYRDAPKEVHITLSALPVRDGRTVHPPLADLGPVTLKPGQSVEITQEHVDRKGLEELVLVYDMLNSTSERYATWRGRIAGPLIKVGAARGDRGKD